MSDTNVVVYGFDIANGTLVPLLTAGGGIVVSALANSGALQDTNHAADVSLGNASFQYDFDHTGAANDIIYSPEIITNNATSLLVAMNLTVVVAGNYDFSIQRIRHVTNAAQTDYNNMITGNTFSGTGWSQNVRVSPQLAQTANLIEKDILPPSIRIKFNTPNTAGRTVGSFYIALSR